MKPDGGATKDKTVTINEKEVKETSNNNNPILIVSKHEQFSTPKTPTSFS